MNRKIIILIFVVLLIGVVIASPSYYFKRGVHIDLKLPCYNETNSMCPSTTTCNISIFYPNGTALVENDAMEHNTAYFNYTIRSTQNVVDGEFPVSTHCFGTNNGFSTFTYMVTQSGKEVTTGNSLLYMGAILIFLLFLGIGIWGFLKANKPITRVLYGGFSYLFLIAISYVLWLTTENILFTTTILSKIFYWVFILLLFSFLPLFFGSMIWLIYVAITIAPMKRMLERGMPEDKVLERSFRMRRGSKW